MIICLNGVLGKCGGCCVGLLRRVSSDGCVLRYMYTSIHFYEKVLKFSSYIFIKKISGEFKYIKYFYKGGQNFGREFFVCALLLLHSCF